MKKRTDIDFSKHEVLVKSCELGMIHHLHIPNTSYHNIRFINVGGVLSVTGDFGNWIFCREFHPSATEYVSDGYWEEKLRISSTQSDVDFDSEGTRHEIQELIDSGDYSDEEQINSLREMKIAADVSTGGEYRDWVNENIDFIDYEYIPYCTETKFWLKCIFDGFDEICNRLKEVK